MIFLTQTMKQQKGPAKKECAGRTEQCDDQKVDENEPRPECHFMLKIYK
jgi:hypothetical protein